MVNETRKELDAVCCLSIECVERIKVVDSLGVPVSSQQNMLQADDGNLGEFQGVEVGRVRLDKSCRPHYAVSDTASSSFRTRRTSSVHLGSDTGCRKVAYAKF